MLNINNNIDENNDKNHRHQHLKLTENTVFSVDKVLLCEYKYPAHNLIDAQILPCGETICKKCLNSSLDISHQNSIDTKETNTNNCESARASVIKCKYCKNEHKEDSIIENKLINLIIDQNSKQSNRLKSNTELLTNLLREVSDKRERCIEFISVKLPSIKLEITNQVEFLKENINEIEEEMQTQLVEFKERIEQLNMNDDVISFLYFFNNNLFIFIFRDLNQLPKFEHILNYIEK
jgi:hypothetical protein